MMTRWSTFSGRVSRGFTLIEVLIVLVVVGILTAIALPAYNDIIRRGHRADAKAVLMEAAQFMDRYYTTNSKFTSVPAGSISAVSPKGASSSAKKYDIDFSVGPTTTTFTLRATPVNSQVGDKCGTLTLAHTGAQTAATAGCW